MELKVPEESTAAQMCSGPPDPDAIVFNPLAFIEVADRQAEKERQKPTSIRTSPDMIDKIIDWSQR